MAEPVEMPLWKQTGVAPKNLVLHGDPDPRGTFEGFPFQQSFPDFVL